MPDRFPRFSSLISDGEAESYFGHNDILASKNEVLTGHNVRRDIEFWTRFFETLSSNDSK